MRPSCSALFPLISLFLLFSTLSYAQTWSGILAPSRAINWGNAGLPTTLPDGETTAHPWTPPANRSVCQNVGVNQSNPNFAQSGVTATTINTAIAACKSTSGGSVVLLYPGTYTLGGTVNLWGGNVTLRGSGPMQTKIILNGASIQMGLNNNAGTAQWASDSGSAQGATTIKINNVSGSVITAGNIAQLYLCDTGTTGYSCSGTPSDNGSVFICGEISLCDIDGQIGSGATYKHQQQTVFVTGVTNLGGGAYSVTFSPGLYMPNWTPTSATISWNNSSYNTVGMGLEDMTVDASSGGAVNVGFAYASWVKGLRIIGAENDAVSVSSSKNILFANNYIFGLPPSAMASIGPNPALFQERDSDNLFLNNIVTYGFIEGGGFDEGDVFAYNYGRDSQTSAAGFQENAEFQHQGAPAFMLMEGNQIGIIRDDDTWGTHNFDTFFRNNLSCYDPPFQYVNAASGLDIDSYARFENAVGNVIGDVLNGSNYGCASYQSASDTGSPAFRIGDSASDALTNTSLMRWGNVTTIKQASDTPTNSGVRFVASEVPSSLALPNKTYSNPVPANTNLPPSFFMNNVSAHPNGGTGLSWWKVCIRWSTFPTSCATYATPPFPAAGPDVTGGPYVNGYAYDNPAALAWKTLPIDTSYQNTYNITSSTWSSGTETLTVSGLPAGQHIQGGFMVTGACAGGEYLMTNSSSTTISYALASNPGSCAGGTVKWPDVRQFDGRVYQADGASAPAAPTGLSSVVQ